MKKRKKALRIWGCFIKARLTEPPKLINYNLKLTSYLLLRNLLHVWFHISVMPIFSLALGGSERSDRADTTPRGPRLSLITTVSHYPPCGGHGGSGDRKHRPPILPQWAVRRQKALSKSLNSSQQLIHVAMYGRCLVEPMEGFRSMLLIQTGKCNASWRLSASAV